MTIWLLTLPEKFNDWYQLHNIHQLKGNLTTPFLPLRERPTFPFFPDLKKYTCLMPNEKNGTYNFLPSGWNLMNCFDYYLEQKEKWTTKSIEMEWNLYNQQKKSPKKMTAS